MVNFVVIPAYNEGNKIKKVLTQVKTYAENVIVVDDGSSDDTATKAKTEKVIVISHSVNLGKGAALKTGCDYAVEKNAQKIVVIDADGQHDPREIPRFFKALDEADIVYSYRKKSEKQPAVLRLGNSLINNSFQRLFKTAVNDSQCGFRSFTAESYQKIRWQATDYFMETEMIIRASKRKLKYKQLPIEMIYADNYKGTTVFDGVKIFCKMVGSRLL
jgi:glycosyltransferase involved in cell wall biosynthesis